MISWEEGSHILLGHRYDKGEGGTEKDVEGSRDTFSS